MANIISRIKSVLFPRVVEASLPSGSIEWLKRYGKEPDVSQTALCRKYFGWTYMCAQLSAVRFASTPLKVYASRGKGQTSVKNFSARKVNKEQSQWLRKRLSKSLPQVAGAEDFEELEEHPLLNLLQSVNDQENGFEAKELTCIMLDLTGDGYWYLERDKFGVPTKIFVLRSQWIRIVPDKEKFVSEFIYGENQYDRTAVHLLPEEVIHFKYPNPLDPWYGMGPVQAAAYSIENNELREKFILATMGNMARPDLIVKYTEGELDPKERQLLEREWNAMFRGAKNAGKVKVTDFRYELDKIGWTPSELDFNKGEDWIMKKICGAFPVPIGLVDTSQISRAPRAGMEGADLFMAQFNTLPRCTRIEEKLNEQLCPMYDERLFVAFDNPVPKDKVAQLNEDTAMLNTYRVTINELRKRDGEEEVPWGDVPLVQAGIAPLGSQPLPTATEAGAGYNQPNKPEAISSPEGGGMPGGAQSEKKSIAGVMTMEVEGQYVHPSLAGIPIRLVRNEWGRFDRRGVGRLRASRDAVESLKGGPGSGSWEGPGDPRFAKEGGSESDGKKEIKDIPLSNMVDADGEPAIALSDKIPKDELSYSKGPVDVAKIEDGYIILDGQHRVAEASRSGKTSINANILSKEEALRKYGKRWPMIEDFLVEGKSFSRKLSTKFIKEEDGMFSVYSHQTGKLFGKYKTRKEAEDRLAQMQRFKGSKDDGEGRWVTMHGSPVFIREGQSAEDAAKERFGRNGKNLRVRQVVC